MPATTDNLQHFLPVCRVYIGLGRDKIVRALGNDPAPHQKPVEAAYNSDIIIIIIIILFISGNKAHKRTNKRHTDRQIESISILVPKIVPDTK